MRRLRRVYFDYELTPVIELDENQSRKLKTVLRAEQGDIVEVLTKEYLAEGEIYIAGKKGVQVRILKKRPVCIPDYKFIVYQCIAKREYMDFIIEKYSELGVTDIIPVISNRSLDSLKSSAYERYIQIAKEAAILIGPEGGFTDKEYLYLINAGFKAHTPINTILKAETAAVLFAGLVRLSINE